MKVIVGLGNPGEKYINTRHNFGFIILESIAREIQQTFSSDEKFKSEIARSDKFILVKPTTFMNNSGEAVSRILNFYKIQPKDLYVIHDDVDLPFGKIKKQFGASSAGHRGVESIINELGTKEFWRVRIGVGKPVDTRIEIEDWVLTNMLPDELTQVIGLVPAVKKLVF
ncbi:aminoacyl-tRNA hydrolase [candidate division WWE3 bacterium]|jgi:PTH1 family peptidyl-tRNA hydrolase|uniref:Peptidyl-tRNA hydrolase n=1 Tax=candidate division WWE3 bacterium TaxID=2053526 RepID=A0A3A4ZG89_UNCKA|nr:MAG: aminoacyl-tRNA hydrolase [candidate division WWE3 bacterium]